MVRPGTLGCAVRGWTRRGALTLRPCARSAGEKRNLTMAPELGYGIKGSPPAVPGNATLKFDVEMLNITMPAAPAPNPLAPLAPLVTTFLQQAVNGIINGK